MTLRLLVTLYDIITASDVLLWIEGVGSSELNKDETSVCSSWFEWEEGASNACCHYVFDFFVY